MDRKEFFKSTLKGTCVCTMLLLGGRHIATAASNDDNAKKDNKDQEFISGWTENLMQIMDQNLDEKTRVKIMEESGRKCAEKTYKKIALNYKGNVNGLLALMKQQWAESADFDKEKGLIRVVGKKAKACVCPMVKGSSTLSSGTFCLCSRGWVKEIFETVTGKKVDVKLEKTILRGGDQCVFNITLTK
jgi:predicted hydrocarbon binding protein